jgi:hypothetical protein
VSGEYLPAPEAVERARAALRSGDRDAMESALPEMDDLDSVGWAEAGEVRDALARRLRWLSTEDWGDLEAALEALPDGTWLRVHNDLGVHRVRKVGGAFWLVGDLAVSAGDVADGRPTHVEVLPDTDHEALALLADLDPEEAAALARRKEHP